MKFNKILLLVVFWAAAVFATERKYTTYDLENRCELNLNCLADMFESHAERLCSPKIVESARHTHEWLDGIFAERF